MSDFKAKMHQIRFPLVLRPKSHWGSLQLSPAVLKEPTSKGIEGKGERGREQVGEEKKERKEGRGKGQG